MENRLKALALQSPEIMETLAACKQCALPNFYLAGGAITQLIWNSLLGNPPLTGVKDFDIVYFDAQDAITETAYTRTIANRLTHQISVDLKNQANVHKWYPIKFGQTIEPYLSAENGIRSWLSAFAIGLTLDEDAELIVYAPYGLEDAFEMNVRPNKIAMTEASYLQMTKSYKSRWPQITIEPWESC